MYEYGMVKSIHDQRMRQFMIEVERSHLIRQLRKNRHSGLSWSTNVANAIQQLASRRPQPAA